VLKKQTERKHELKNIQRTVVVTRWGGYVTFFSSLQRPLALALSTTWRDKNEIENKAIQTG
jgi:hypothetical protein